MRADRLISIIMLLQTHERMTADELSVELEVSPRTIYRDILALNTAGIPIYTDRGPGGGIALMESYRTSLTGMSEDETRALFMLNIPQALIDLGVGPELKRALLKLAVALPSSQKRVQARTQQRIYLDSTAWDEPAEPSAHLAIIQQAIWQDRRIRLAYQGNFETRLEFEIEPLGLVAKINTWYLVGRHNEFNKVFNVDDILRVEILEEHFVRGEDFDLGEFWTGWCKSSQARRSFYPVLLAVAPALLKKLPIYLGEAVKFSVDGPSATDGKGWSKVTIYYDNFFRARESILNFGYAAIVLEPEAMKLSVQDFARQIINLYQTCK